MSDYKGKISNKGSQSVKAPYPQKPTPKKDVQSGKDLRIKK